MGVQMFSDPQVIALSRELDRQDAAGTAYTAAHKATMAQAVDAFASCGDVCGMSAAYALRDWLHGGTDEQRTESILRALQSAADGKPEARMQAMAIIASFARDMADLYAEEA